MAIFFDAIVIGASAGGLNALRTVFSCLDETVIPPIMVVQHVSPDTDMYVCQHYDALFPFLVKEAEDKEILKAGTVYFAPPDYHLMVEPDRSLSLSCDKRINYSRPSIDVLFETAAEVFLNRLIGVVLTGANADGANGLKHIKTLGGTTVVQSPGTAAADTMPSSAIQSANPHHIIDLDALGQVLNRLCLEGPE